MAAIFIHGLDSSGQGTKAQFFAEHFPHVLRPDFRGFFKERMAALDVLLAGKRDLVLIGSSFGGLMGAVFAIEHPERLRRLVMLAPALNFPDFEPYRDRHCGVETWLFQGRYDTVTPPDEIEPLARAVFSDLHVVTAEDDHLLHKAFPAIDWGRMLA